MAQKIITDIIQAEIQVGKKIKLNQDNLKKYSEFNSEQAFEQLKRSSNNTTLESSISGIFSKGVIDIERLVQLYKLQDENITPIELQSIISRYSSTSGEIVGLDYDGFQKLVGQNITDTKRKNPIFENSNLQNSKAGQPLSERSMVALQSIFLLELDLLRFTEKQKVILKNTFNYEPMNFFNSINFNNSAALNFEQLQQFFRSNGQEISKEDYQVLISRIKRSKQLSSNDYDQFISQQEFIQLTVPHLPYSNKLSAAALNVSKASVQGQQQQQQQQQVNSLKQNDKSVKFQLEGENNVDISNVILSPAAVNVNFQQQQQSKQAADLQQVENFQLNSNNICNNVMYGDSISVQNQNIQLMQQQQLLQQQKEQQQQQQLYLQQQKEQQQQQQLQQQQQQLQLQQLQQQQQQQQQQYKQQQQQQQPQQIQQQPQQQQYQQQQQQQYKQQQPQQYNQQQPQSQSAQIAPQTLGYNIGQVQQQKPQPIYAVPEYVYIKQDQQPFQQIPQQSYNIIPNVVQENVEINTVNQNNNNRANLALQAMNDLLQKDNDRLKQENLDLQQKLIEKEQLEQRARDKEELRALIMLENKQLLEQQQQQQQLQKQQLQQQQPQVELVQKQQPQQVFVAVPQLQQQLPVIQSNTALVNKYLQFQPQPQQLNSVRLSEVRPPVNAVSFPQQLQQQPLQLLQPSVINQDNFINSQPPVSSGVIHQFPGSALSSLPSAIKKPVGPASPSSPLVNTSMFSPQNTHSQQIANELVHSSYASPNVPLPGYILEPNQVPSFLVGAQQFNNRAGLANQFSPYTQAHHYNATQTELREAIHNQLPAPQQQFVQQQQQQAQYPFIPREYAQPNSGFQYPLQYP